MLHNKMIPTTRKFILILTPLWAVAALKESLWPNICQFQPNYMRFQWHHRRIGKGHIYFVESYLLPGPLRWAFRIRPNLMFSWQKNMVERQPFCIAFPCYNPNSLFNFKSVASISSISSSILLPLLVWLRPSFLMLSALEVLKESVLSDALLLFDSASESSIMLSSFSRNSTNSSPISWNT